MPLDPTISLGINVPQPQASPLDTIGKFAQTQNWLNSNRLFQQTFAARQRAGELLSHADPNDPEAGIRSLFSDPLTAAFAPDIANSIRQSESTLLDLQGKQLGQSQSALQSFVKSLPGALADPSMLPGLIKSNLATLPPGAQITPQVKSAMGDLVTSLMDGLPDDKGQASQTFRDRLAGLSMSAGITPETIRAITGSMPPQLVKVTGPQGQEISTIIGGPAAQAGTGNALGGSTPLAVGPSATQSQYLSGRGTDMAKYQENLDSTVNGIYSIMQNVQEAKSAMEQFKPGGGASVYGRLASLAQGLGAGNELVDKISNGNLAATQEFQKLMVNNVMAQVRDQLPSGSRLAQYEFREFQKNNPNIDTDPRAIDRIFNFWNKLYGQKSDEQTSLNSFLQGGGAGGKPGDISLWPAEWQKIAKSKGYVGGLEIPNTSPAGTGGGKATMEFIPGKGLVPVQ